MNPKFEDLLYSSGLTAQGCWDQLDDYTKDAILRYGELVIRECAGLLKKEAESNHDEGTESYNTLIRESKWIKQYFGVEE